MPDANGPRLERRDWRFALGTAVATTLLAMLPALLGALLHPAGYAYTGIHVNAPADYPVYYGWIESIVDGHWLVQPVFTAEGTGAFLHSFWLVTGLVGRLGDIDPRVLFQLARLVVVPLGVCAWAWGLKFWVPEPRRWRWALGLLLFAGGLGFWLSLWQGGHGIVPAERTYAMDVWVSEGFNGITLLHSPHMVASSALLFLAFTLLARSLAGGRPRDAALAGLCAAVLGTFHPFHLLALAAVPFVLFGVLTVRARGFPRAAFGRLALYGATALPGALTYVVLVLSDPTTQERLQQNVTPTTVLSVTLWSYGFLLPLALVALVPRLRRADPASLLLGTWFVVHALLLYAPVVFQRRLTQGFQFPLTILAFEGLLLLRGWLFHRFPPVRVVLTGTGSVPLVVLGLVLGFGMSFATVYGSELQLVLDPTHHNLGSVTYLPQEEVGGYRWLRRNAGEGDLTLGLNVTGLFAAGLSGRRTYVGHAVETLNFMEKRADAYRFYGSLSGDARAAFLRERDIALVLETSRERALNGPPLAGEPFLTPIYRTVNLTVYRVTGS